MNESWLKHNLTPEERRTFAEQGYMVIENAIPQALVERATVAIDRITAEEKSKEGMGQSDGINILDLHRGGMTYSWSYSTIPRPFPKCGASSAGTSNLLPLTFDYHAAQCSVRTRSAGDELAQGQRAGSTMNWRLTRSRAFRSRWPSS